MRLTGFKIFNILCCIFFVFAIFMVALFTFGAIVTPVNSVSQEQSLINFENYSKEIKAISESKSLTYIPLPNNGDLLFQQFEVIDKNNNTISIEFQSNADEKSKGKETVLIYYNIKKGNSFDVELFVELVNGVSGRNITVEQCNNFLSDPEEKHPIEKYGFSKDENCVIAKYERLNFWEDWMYSYYLHKDGTQEFDFWGLTKGGVK